MGRRYENEDSTGAKVWLQDGMEVHQVSDKFRCCAEPGNSNAGGSWVPGNFSSVDEAFVAGRIFSAIKSTTGNNGGK